MFQSYLFSASKYNFNVYEKRILYRMIDFEQRMINQDALDKSVKIDVNLWGDKEYTIPMTMLLSADEDDNDKKSRSKNNKRFIDAFNALMDKKISYEDEEVYWRVGIISRFEFKKRDRVIKWKADEKIIQMIADFSKGWRAYELKVAYNLKSVYAMRFYELIGNKKSPITYITTKFLRMFNLEDKYKQKNGKPNFKLIEKYVLKKAQEELDKVSPYTFNYHFSKDYNTITIIPIFQEKYSNVKYEKRQKNANLLEVFTQEEIKVFIDEFGFTEQGLKNNYALFEDCKKTFPPNYTFFLFQQIRESIKGKTKNIPPYVIGIIRNMLNDFKNK